jgi:hypothetical protein
VASAYEVNRELQRIQRQQTGMFQPRVIVHGIGGSPSPYIVRATDWLLLVDASGGAITITFPDAARLDGLFVTVIKTDSSANAVTLSATINGVVNPTLTQQYDSKIVQSGNGVWYSTPPLGTPMSWTPTDQSGAGLTFGSPIGSYVKVGPLVFVSCSVVFPTTASAVNVQIGPLPFPIPSTIKTVASPLSSDTSSFGASYFAQAFAGGSTVFIVTAAQTGQHNSVFSGLAVQFTLVYHV